GIVVVVFEILFIEIIGTNGDSIENNSYLRKSPRLSFGLRQFNVISPFNSSLTQTLLGKSIPHLFFVS
ncbi:MAG: hypothetical protein ACK48V_11065, partial [Crocinitomicaceae bacterium]